MIENTWGDEEAKFYSENKIRDKQQCNGYNYIALNIFYCSILNNWRGHKFHNLETSSPKL